MKKKWIAVITAVCMISLFGCLHYLHEMQEEKYTVITSVNGVEFDVPKNYLTQATAIQVFQTMRITVHIRMYIVTGKVPIYYLIWIRL